MDARDPFAFDEDALDGDGTHDDERDRRVDISEGDALDHLWNAAHEMLSAMRTVLDAADEFVASQREARPVNRAERDPGAGRAGRVRHINIDERPDAGTGAK